MSRLTFVFKKIRYHKKMAVLLTAFFMFSVISLSYVSLLSSVNRWNWQNKLKTWESIGISDRHHPVIKLINSSYHDIQNQYALLNMKVWAIILCLLTILVIVITLFQKNEITASFNLGFSKRKIIAQAFLTWSATLFISFVLTVALSFIFFNSIIVNVRNQNQAVFDDTLSINLEKQEKSFQLPESKEEEKLMFPLNPERGYSIHKDNRQLTVRYFSSILLRKFFFLTLALLGVILLVTLPYTMFSAKKY
ncbi:hypothetical protein ACWN8V_02315 [Vagococcus elongatus]|uniref:Uncharacterized protein n=1 Tax=Vagococcus elongatus TaxID=180344 RepID=A0A430B4F1_9ENTE|nr:hypothetical protein [Vagococcus elongatus]RSU15121.1 hypothetical protein CBF29_01965 [Vagococcus elongatus]